MASKLAKFIDRVKVIIQETTDKQTDVLLAKFDQVFPEESEDTAEEPNKEPEEESEDTAEEPNKEPEEESAEDLATEDLKAYKETLFARVDEAVEEAKEERKSLLEKLQSIYDTLVTYIREEREPEPTGSVASSAVDTNPDSPTVDASSEVAQTVAASDSTKGSKGSKAGTLAILSMLGKVAAKVFSPIKAIFGAFSNFLADRKAKLVLIIMTALTIVAGLITLVKWVYDNIAGIVVGWCQKLWDGVMWVYDKLAGLISEVWEGFKDGVDGLAQAAGFDPIFSEKKYVPDPEYKGLTPEQIAEKKSKRTTEAKSDATTASTVQTQPMTIPINPDAEKKKFRDALEKTIQEREKSAPADSTKDTTDATPDTSLPIGDTGDSVDMAQVTPVVNNSSYNVDNKIFEIHTQSQDDYYSI